MAEIRKSIYKLDRLEGLQANAKLRLVKATAKASAGLDEHFAKTAANAANVVKQTMGDITGFPRVANRAGPIPTLSCGNAHRS